MKAKAKPEKANITLKLDRNLLREVKILAAEKDTSISALLTVQLETIVRDRGGYEEAKKRALARMRKGLDIGWNPPTSRDELYER